jgi:hypothetical protein
MLVAWLIPKVELRQVLRTSLSLQLTISEKSQHFHESSFEIFTSLGRHSKSLWASETLFKELSRDSLLSSYAWYHLYFNDLMCFACRDLRKCYSLSDTNFDVIDYWSMKPFCRNSKNLSAWPHFFDKSSPHSRVLRQD